MPSCFRGRTDGVNSIRARLACGFALAVLLASSGGFAQAEAEVTGIKASCRNGQTFITWKDAAEGQDATNYLYSVYRSDRPIRQQSLAEATLIQSGILYNSARMYGYGFSGSSRLDPAKPLAIIEEGGAPLPMWSGVTAVTVKQDGKSYYAVVATRPGGRTVSAIEPSVNSLSEPVVEKVAPVQPIKLPDPKGVSIKAEGKRLPLAVVLHPSNNYPSDRAFDPPGDRYLYFATREMGYRDGLQGDFMVRENADKDFPHLTLQAHDAIEKPGGKPEKYTQETFWFGYVCVPQWAAHKEPRAYPFTERRMLWMLDWVCSKYGVDRNRVYCRGGSMGAWGTTSFAFRHPEIFAAVYPDRPRTRQKGFCSIVPVGKTFTMDDGKTDYFERMDTVTFVSGHHGDLPFYGWCCGRRDGFASFKEQIEMVKAMTDNHHGFAFAWNDGDHSSGSAPKSEIAKYYPMEKFALDQSYPAFGHSSIDNDPGTGELDADKKVKDGELTGGINLGFFWSNIVDQPGSWSVSLSNDLAKADMTVDVTPRRCQQFKPSPGRKVQWTNSAGGSGVAAVDEWGLVTVKQVKIPFGGSTTLTLK